jgi:hypothetical protein
MAVATDLTDPELAERLAADSYYADRLIDMAIDRETEMDPEAKYFCLRWEELSDSAQRPFRTAVQTTLDHLRRGMAVV